MLHITIPEIEMYDSEKNLFYTTESKKFILEHSLISISRWESKWKKPFLYKSEQKTNEELYDYIRCMSVGKQLSDFDVKNIPEDTLKDIISYMGDSMTATWFREDKSKGKKKSNSIITSEKIYYWMTAYNIPFECEKWHINRLLTLIRVCNEENNPRKMSRKDIMAENRVLNAARKAKLRTKG